MTIDELTEDGSGLITDIEISPKRKVRALVEAADQVVNGLGCVCKVNADYDSEGAKTHLTVVNCKDGKEMYKLSVVKVGEDRNAVKVCPLTKQARLYLEDMYE